MSVQITGIFPNSGNISSPLLVTIKGTGFTGATLVLFSPQAAFAPGTFIVDDDNTIRIFNVNIIPVVPGVVSVIVTTPMGPSPINGHISFFTYRGDWKAYVPCSTSSNIFAFDASTNTIDPPPIAVPIMPNRIVSVCIIPNGRIAYFIDINSMIYIVNCATNAIITTVTSAGTNPIFMAISPNGSRGYICNFGSDDVSVYNIANPIAPILLATIAVGNRPSCIAVTPNGSIGYVTNSTSGNITKINLGSNTVSTTIPLPPGINTSVPSFFSITPDGLLGLVSDFANNRVIPITNLIFSAVFGTPILGFMGPNFTLPSISINSAGTMAYVTNTSNDSISPIDIASLTKGTDITIPPLGSGPIGISLTPDGKFAYVVGLGTNNTIIVDLASSTTTSVPVGTDPSDTNVTPDQAPLANFTTTFVDTTMREVKFDASTSNSPTGVVVSYRWNFGDGTPVVSTPISVINHTYATPGNYTVTLTVTNSAGTSTLITYTGAIVSNNGGSNATLSLPIVIAINNPTITTEFCSLSSTINVGESIRDTAMLLGGFNTTGTITFQAVTVPDNIVVFHSVVTVTPSSSMYHSAEFTPTTPGIYYFSATYSGDVNNSPATSEEFSEILTVVKKCKDSHPRMIKFMSVDRPELLLKKVRFSSLPILPPSPPPLPPPVRKILDIDLRVKNYRGLNGTTEKLEINITAAQAAGQDICVNANVRGKWKISSNCGGKLIGSQQLSFPSYAKFLHRPELKQKIKAGRMIYCLDVQRCKNMCLADIVNIFFSSKNYGGENLKFNCRYFS